MSGPATERLITVVIDVGYHVHAELGPGLLESVYEKVLANRLTRLGIKVELQKPVNIVVDEIIFSDAYRVDLFLDDHLVVELKAIEKISGLHIRQTLTYIQLLNQPVGLLLNFGCERWSDGVRRVMNNMHQTN
jgi:GxxExxY protein